MQIVIDIPKEDFEWLKNHPNSIPWSPIFTNAIIEGTSISNNATNGDVIKTMFPNATISILKSEHEKTKVAVEWNFKPLSSYYNLFYEEWWNAPYKTKSE